MTEARPLVSSVVERARRLGTSTWSLRRSPSSARNGKSVGPVEIVAPDRQSMARLLEETVSLFPAELVATDAAWVVRFQPPPGGAWVLDFLALVERWLESCRLSSAEVLYGDRRYQIRSTPDIAQFRAAAESPHGTRHG